MSRRGYTTKPCPICGNTTERPQNKLCKDCEKLILLGKDFLKLQEDLKNQTHVPAYIGTWSRRFYLNKTHFSLDEKLYELLHELVFLISKPMPDEYDRYDFYSNSKMYAYNHPKKEEIKIFEIDREEPGKHIIFNNKRKAEILNELKNTIEKALLEVEKSGIEYGKNILMQMHKGDITVKDFDDNIL